jgi:hypothetical protein
MLRKAYPGGGVNAGVDVHASLYASVAGWRSWHSIPMLRKAYPGGDAFRRIGILRHVFSTQASSRNRAFWSFGVVAG